MRAENHIGRTVLLGSILFASGWGLDRASFFPPPLHAQERTPAREIGRTTERELKVVLSSTFGTLAVARGETEKILIVKSDAGDRDPRVTLDYSVRNRVGYLDLKLGDPGENHDGGGFHFANLDRGSWALLFNDAVPISFEVELGVGKGRFDFTGLNIRDFKLSAGASDVRVTFDRPNETSIDNITIESGVSKFEGRNLGNANFKHLKFQGGVGAYVLDFGGELEREVDVDAEVGLGVLTMIIPARVGARVFYEKNWVSDLDLPADFSSDTDNVYTSDNYTSARARMNIRVDSGFGSIRIRRP
jgi:hypothetical protein